MTARRRRGTYEFCDTCRAGVDTYRTRDGLFCDNCDTHLFDRDDREVIPTRFTNPNPKENITT